MRLAARVTLTCALTALIGCGGSGDGPTSPTSPTTPNTPTTDNTPLRAYAAAHSRFIGAAVDRGFRYAGSDGVNFRALMAREFNMLVPENDMKHSYLQPSQGVYRFVSADSLVAFAEANGMRIRGHTLIWHSQLAGWMANGTWTQDQARALLADHVGTVVTHFKGHVAEWDVVNEAFNDDGTRRASIWQNTIGRDYIERAFIAAHADDPSVGLFYNDYNIEGINAKSDSVYAMIQDFKQRGVPITGVGFQSHFIVGQIPSTLSANIQRFAALGLEVHLTELDIRMPPPATAASLEQQAQDYRTVVNACIAVTACNTIVLWGVSDRESWVPSTFSGQGAALLFDESYAAKPAYAAVQSALK